MDWTTMNFFIRDSSWPSFLPWQIARRGSRVATEDPTAALQMAGSFPTPATVAWWEVPLLFVLGFSGMFIVFLRKFPTEMIIIYDLDISITYFSHAMQPPMSRCPERQWHCSMNLYSVLTHIQEPFWSKKTKATTAAQTVLDDGRYTLPSMSTDWELRDMYDFGCG